MPLRSVGMNKMRVFGISVVVALMMLPGVAFGIFFGTLSALLHIFFIAFTFGAITYVISDEIIPESHEHGFQKSATFALIFGILSVLFLRYLL